MWRRRGAGREAGPGQVPHQLLHLAGAGGRHGQGGEAGAGPGHRVQDRQSEAGALQGKQIFFWKTIKSYYDPEKGSSFLPTRVFET